MAIPEIVETLDVVPEVLREDYEQIAEGDNKGKFQLKIIAGLKKSQQQILAEKKRRDEELEALRRKYDGIEDPQQARDAIARIREIEERKAREEGDFESLKKSMQDGFDKQKQTLEAEITLRDRHIEKYLIESQASAAIAALEGKPVLLMPHIKSQTRVVKDADGFRAEVIDQKSGQVRYNSKGEPMTIRELVEEMAASDDYAPAFRARGEGGSGARRTEGGSTPAIRSKADFKSATEKAAYIREHGADKYNALPVK